MIKHIALLLSFIVMAAAPSFASDFATRCAAPGVIKCVGFDSSAEIPVNPNQSNSGPQGILPATFLPVIDTTTKISGAGSLLMTVPAGSPGASVGAFFTNFANDYSVRFGENTDFYVQWRQRLDQNYVDASIGTGTGNSGLSMKQIIIGMGSTTTYRKHSCEDSELVVQNISSNGIPGMYNDCGRYLGLRVVASSGGYGSPDYLNQNARPNPPGCWHYAPTYAHRVAPLGSCIPYTANNWTTYQIHVHVGIQAQHTNPDSPGTHFGWYWDGSTVEAWIAQEGQPSIQILNIQNFSLGPLRSTSVDTLNQKYGQVWLLPYTTEGSFSQTSSVWYDDLIISTNLIADPADGGTSGSPTLALVLLALLVIMLLPASIISRTSTVEHTDHAYVSRDRSIN